jgi:hypothetical protein
MEEPQIEVPSMSENPFFHRGPITDPDYFFGREEETEKTLHMLRKGQCVSVVGARHIGKTSFLFHLLDADVQEKHGLGDEFLFVYVNCEGFGDLDRLRFFQQLWKEVRKVLQKHGDAGPKSMSGFDELRDELTRIDEAEYRPILLLDEFEGIADNSKLDKDFFSALRSLVPTVIYVTASADSLIDLRYTGQDVVSPRLFSYFFEVHLGFFKPIESEKMIGGLLGLVDRKDLFGEDDLRVLLDIGGHHPFYLQLACSSLFEERAILREAAALVAKIHQTLEQGRSTQLSRIIRGLRSNAERFGTPSLVNLCQELES